LNAGDSEEGSKTPKYLTPVPETVVKLFDFTMPNPSSKEFKIDETYLKTPTEKFEERGPKATKGRDWNVELNNKNDEPCFLTIESFYPRYELLVEQKKIEGEEKIRFLFWKYQTDSTLLNGYYKIKIWRANTPLDEQPDIVKVVNAHNATAFLSLDGDELLPQKGAFGSTESGLNLKRNINFLYPEIVLERDPDFYVEWKRSQEEKAFINRYLEEKGNGSESPSSKKKYSRIIYDDSN
jgi:hypothetical protein